MRKGDMTNQSHWDLLMEYAEEYSRVRKQRKIQNKSRRRKVQQVKKRTKRIKAKAGTITNTESFEPCCKNCAKYGRELCSDPFAKQLCEDYQYNGHGNLGDGNIVPNRTRGAY